MSPSLLWRCKQDSSLFSCHQRLEGCFYKVMDVVVIGVSGRNVCQAAWTFLPLEIAVSQIQYGLDLRLRMFSRTFSEIVQNFRRSSNKSCVKSISTHSFSSCTRVNYSSRRCILVPQTTLYHATSSVFGFKGLSPSIKLYSRLLLKVSTCSLHSPEPAAATIRT